VTAPTHHDLANTLRQQAATDDAHRLAVLLGKGEK
jgi:hypothetical protein